MNTKGIKFLAVLAVLAMAFAVFAVVTDSQDESADAVKVAKIGETEYETLAEAFTAAEGMTGDVTIEIIADCHLTANATLGEGDKLLIPKGKTVTIDAGITLTVVGTVDNNGTIINNYADKDTYWVSKDVGFVISGAKASVEGNGLIKGTYSPQVTLKQGKIDGQTVSRADNVDGAKANEEAIVVADVDGPEDNWNVDILNVKVLNIETAGKDGHAIKVNQKYQGTVTIDNVTFASLTGEAIQVEDQINIGQCSHPSYTLGFLTKISNLKVENLTINDTHAFLNLDTDGIKIGPKGSNVSGIGVTFDNTVQSFRASNNVVIADNLTINEKILMKAGKTITIDSDKTLTIGDKAVFNITNAADKVVVNGTLINNGKINVKAAGATIDNKGKVTNNGAIYCVNGSVLTNATGEITSTGLIAIEYIPAFTLTNPVTVKNGGSLIAYETNEGKFKKILEYFIAGEGSEFTYGDNDADGRDIIVKSGTVYVAGNINNNWTLELQGSAIVDVPASATLTIKEGAKLKGESTSTVYIEKGGFFVLDGDKTGFNGKVDYAGEEAVITDVTTNQGIKDAIENDDVGAAVVTITATDGTTKNVEIGTKDLALNITNEAVITNLNFEVAKGGSLAINTTSNVTSTYSGTVTLGTQKITMTGVKGNFTLVPGSIVIDGEISGTLVVDDGAELVVEESLIVTGATTISVVGDGSASLTVKKEATVNLGAALTINAGIDVEVFGKIAEGDAVGSITVNVMHLHGGSSVVDNLAIATTGDDPAITVYSGSDINSASIADGQEIYWTGKDIAGGKWTLDADGKLILDNYNGTYNLGGFVQKVTSIELVGDNKVTWKVPATYAGDLVLFGGANTVTKISTDIGTGSLEINVDVSKVKTTNMIAANTLTVISATKDFNIDEALVKILVSGSNSAWTDEALENFVIKGINTPAEEGTVKMYNSTLVVDIMSAYDIDAEFIVGMDIGSTGAEITTSNVAVSSASVAFSGNTVTVKGSNVAIAGNADIGTKLEVSNSSEIIVNGVLSVKKLTVNQESSINAKSMILGGTNDVAFDAGENKASISVEEIFVLTNKSSFKNYASMDVAGETLVLGTLINEDGSIKNSGEVLVPVKIAKTSAADETIAFDNSTASLGTNAAMAKTISFGTSATLNDDGSVDLAGATVTFTLKDVAETVAVAFTGKLVPMAAGEGYVLLLKTADDSAVITVTYDSTKVGTTADVIGKDWVVGVIGNVTIDETKYNLVSNVNGKGVVSSITFPADVLADSGAALTLKKGEIHNDGVVAVYQEFTVDTDATFTGDLNAFANVIVKGTVNGNIVSEAGTVTLNKDSEMEGNISAKDNVTINGEILGNVTADGTVTIGADGKMAGKIANNDAVEINGALMGDVEITLENGSESTFTVGADAQLLTNLTYNSKYKAQSGDTTDTTGTAVMGFIGNAAFVINLKKGTDATTTEPGVPGYFTFGGNPAVADPEKESIAFSIAEGRFVVDSSITMPEGSLFAAGAGTIFEIVKNYTFDVKEAALVIDDGATALIDLGSDVPEYGTVLYIMMFHMSEGATAFSNAAYALSNCDEGSILKLGDTTTINSAVSVKKGVTITVDDVTLTFNGKDVKMGEGAAIILEGNGKVIFKETGSNILDLEEGDEITYYTVSATITYGDNKAVFENVRFTDDSTISGVAATASTVAKIKTDLKFDEGIAKIAAGTGTGTIIVGNDINDETLDADPETYCVYGTFVVAADAVFDAVKIEDAAEIVTYTDDDPATATDVPEIKEVVKWPTIVGVEGTLNLLDNTVLKGTYVGTGKVTLAAGKSLTIDSAFTPDFSATLAYPGSINAYVVDTTDDSNGYLFNLVTTKAEDDGTGLIITATTYTYEGEKYNVVTLKGTVQTGAIKATTEAFLDTLTVAKDAVVYGDEVYIIGATNADGYVGAVEIYKDEAPFKALTYEVTFEKDGYTIYTKFAAVDWDTITDVTIEKGEIPINKKLDLTGKDVNIVIGEDAALKLNAIMIIGTPITILGDSTGSSISGKVIITNNVYLIAYADVDLSEAEIVGDEEPTQKDAVFSKLDVENVPYATIFAKDGNAIKLSKADSTLVPEIVGYNFTAWLNYNGDAGAVIGDTNAYADAKAVLCTVMVKYVAGVDYYMNGVLFNVYDIPTDVPYGSYFTAKISDTTKYQGNPVINGEKTVCVIDDMELVASGVTPIPEPTPEPVEENTGLSLTDILLIVLVILIAIMVVILVLRLNRS